MGPFILIGMLSFIRITTLTAERIALNRLGQAQCGTLATMAVGFGGAAVVLWVMACLEGQAVFILSTFGTGAIYALAFGFYTAALAKGPVSVVTPWSNATVILLWLFRPMGGLLALLGLLAFGVGAVVLMNRRITLPVIYMLLSDVLLASARFIDVEHLSQPSAAYAASLFTMISFWMLIPVVTSSKQKTLWVLVKREPGWSFIAASSNAAAYLSLFLLLRWLHPASVEAISAVASSAAVLAGVLFLRERQLLRKSVSSALMTAGTILLLLCNS